MAATRGSGTIAWYEDAGNVGARALYYLLEEMDITPGKQLTFRAYTITRYNPTAREGSPPSEYNSDRYYAQATVAADLLNKILDEMNLAVGGQVDFAERYRIRRINSGERELGEERGGEEGEEGDGGYEAMDIGKHLRRSPPGKGKGFVGKKGVGGLGKGRRDLESFIK
jgi:hypothetical protein